MVNLLYRSGIHPKVLLRTYKHGYTGTDNPCTKPGYGYTYRPVH